MKNYAWDGTLGDMVPIGLTPAGFRMDVSFAGTLTEGELAGSELRGTDYLLLRHDGIGVIDAHEVIVVKGGAGAVHAHAMGYITPPFAMPPLDALLDPGFSWPDVDLPMHGAVRLESGEKASPVNSIMYSFTGAVNVAQGKLRVSAIAIS